MRHFFTTSGSNRFSGFWCKVFILCAIVIVSFTTNGISQTVFTEDWESGIGSWFADNGLWEVGVPTVGPANAHSGQNVAGTILDGNYPSNANTRLTSPQVTLPNLSSGEKLKLRFWQWFRIDRTGSQYDYGYIEISTDNGNTWEKISGNYDEYSEVWTQAYIDISAYSDSVVRIGFNFISSSAYTDNGWYVDDVSILKGTDVFYNPEDFELGMGDWSVDNGLWEIGIPTVGPDSSHSGQICAGTVLDGNYFSSANTRLISPELTLSGQNPELFFWHWYRFDHTGSQYDYGEIQISVNGGIWQDLAGPFDDYNPTWSQGYVSLSAYTDSTVRIGFNFISSSAYTDNGWYIDDIRIEGLITEIGGNQDKIPTEFVLLQNYPNPFNPSTKIKYAIPEMGFVTLKVYDVLGNEVATIVNEEKPTGSYVVEFDGNELTSGVYFYKLQAGSFVETKKMVLMK